MNKISIALLALTTIVATQLPLKADSVKAYCIYTQDTTAVFPDGIPVKGECDFAQYGGNIYIDLDGVTHHYAYAQQGRLFQRTNRREGIWLKAGDSLMTVFWAKPTFEPAGY